VNAAEEEWYPI